MFIDSELQFFDTSSMCRFFTKIWVNSTGVPRVVERSWRQNTPTTVVTYHDHRPRHRQDRNQYQR